MSRPVDTPTGTYPPGPALLYVHADARHGLRFDDDVRTLTQVDLSAPAEGGPLSAADAARERALLRALLVHALRLLDEAETA